MDLTMRRVSILLLAVLLGSSAVLPAALAEDPPTFSVSRAKFPNDPIRNMATTVSKLLFPENLSIRPTLGVQLEVNLRHSRVQDLVIWLKSPEGTRAKVRDHVTGPSNLTFTVTPGHFAGEESAGAWVLEVRDTRALNTGTLDSWRLTLLGTTPADPHAFSAGSDVSQPIADLQTVASAAHVPLTGTVTSVAVEFDIAHTRRGDLVVKLQSPDGFTVTLHNRTGGGQDNLQFVATPGAFRGRNPNGTWTATVQDTLAPNTGTWQEWDLVVRATGGIAP
jgi:subtilisin-like proprotein convertase family protein